MSEDRRRRGGVAVVAAVVTIAALTTVCMGTGTSTSPEVTAVPPAPQPTSTETVVQPPSGELEATPDPVGQAGGNGATCQPCPNADGISGTGELRIAKGDPVPPEVAAAVQGPTCSGGLGEFGGGLGGGGYGVGGGGAGMGGIGSGSAGYGLEPRFGGVVPTTTGMPTSYHVPPPDELELGSRGTVRSEGGLGLVVDIDRVGGFEDYTDHGINDSILSEDDRFSTFAVDVDTGAYTLARRKLQSGTLPRPAGVRVEEFVNYFPYEYAPPSDSDAPFAVYMEAAPSPIERDHHLLRVAVKGKEVEPEARTPLHLTFLVDVSCSMTGGDRIGLARKSLHHLVDNLQDDDTVALATYAGRVASILDPTPVSDATTVHEAIDALQSGGSTAMESGLMLAYDKAMKSFVAGHENRVLVLSDGDANVGRTSHEEILESIEQYAGKGITLSTIGFGVGNYKDSMMEQLADKGDGNYAYVDSFDEAKRLFGDQLGATMQVIARDVKIQVEFNPEAVLAWRLVGYENRDIADEDFRRDEVDAGEIGSGHAVTALYDVELREDPHPELATVRLRAKPPGVDAAAKEWVTRFDRRRLHLEYPDASQDFQRAATVALFAEKLRQSPHTVEVSYAEIQKRARWSRLDTAADAELIGLIAKAGRLAGEAL